MGLCLASQEALKKGDLPRHKRADFGEFTKQTLSPQENPVFW